jgi:hypothetical protein
MRHCALSPQRWVLLAILPAVALPVVRQFQPQVAGEDDRHAREHHARCGIALVEREVEVEEVADWVAVHELKRLTSENVCQGGRQSLFSVPLFGMDIAKYIAKRRNRAGGMEALSRETTVSRPMLYRMLGGDCNPTLKQLEKMGLEVVEASRRKRVK